MRRERRKIPERGRLPGIDGIHRLTLLVLALIATLAILGTLPDSVLSVETARAETPGTLSIFVPVPNSSGAAFGPVGANVTITGSGLTPSVAFQLGAATSDAGCTAFGFQPFTGDTVNTDSSGNFQTTFTWPSSLATSGTTYYICAEDTSSTFTQSQSTFEVDGNSAPAITGAKLVPGPTPGPGTPTLPTNAFYPGSTVEIDGSNFFPGSTTIKAYLTTSQISQPSDFTNATELTAVTGQPITSDSNGQVTATVQIPGSQATGIYYLYLVSADGAANGQNALPALMAASSSITLQTAPPAPTATATTVAATPTTATSTTTGTGPSNGPGPGKLAAVVGLGGLSVVLFILGVMLLASAATLPRQQG
jgi:hypothetical protein